jgi:hypothetical protein
MDANTEPAVTDVQVAEPAFHHAEAPPSLPPAPDRGAPDSTPNTAFSAFPAILALAVLGTQLYLVMGRNFLNILETPFLPYCLLGAFSIHMATRPGRKERFSTLAIAAIAILWFAAFSGKFRPTWSHTIACGAFTGLASLTVLAVQVLRSRGNAQTERLNTLFAGSVFGYSAILIAGVLNLTTKLHPRTYDLYLYAADKGFGLPIAAWTGQFLLHHAILLRTCAFVYESLPLAISLLYAYQRSGSKPLALRVLPAFLGGGVAVYVLYNFLPAAGPVYAFGAAFPNHLPALTGLHLISLGDAARNAIPSMHLACALLIFWNSRRLPKWAYAASALYLALTALATVGLGEHYVIDLVPAVPYALMMQAACAPATLRSRREWKQTLALGAALTAVWMLAARFGTPLFHSIVFTWMASAATLVLCAMARRRMLPAESSLAKTES